jgi:signal transduction histidine kinase
VRLDRLPLKARAGIIAGCFLLVGAVGYMDAHTPHVAFSIFYVIPIVVAAWSGNRLASVIFAVASDFTGLLADMTSNEVQRVYAYTNFGFRLVLFLLVALLVSRLKEMMGREQKLMELEREAAERLQELNTMKDALMRSVVVDAREPLSDIYARIVTLGFDLPTLTESDTREVLSEIADATRRLADLVSNLTPPQHAAPSTGSSSDVDVSA